MSNVIFSEERLLASFPDASHTAQVAREKDEEHQNKIKCAAYTYLERTVGPRIMDEAMSRRRVCEIPIQCHYFGDDFALFTDTILGFLHKKGYSEARLEHDANGSVQSKKLVVSWWNISQG